MKIEILDALIEKWGDKSTREASKAVCGDPSSAVNNATEAGVRMGRKECIDDLINLIKLLG